jgi:hypothetical protein
VGGLVCVSSRAFGIFGGGGIQHKFPMNFFPILYNTKEKNTKKMSVVTIHDEESKKVKEKRKLLRDIHNKCMTEHKAYKKRYKKLKWRDDLVDVAHTSLNMSAVALTISGFGVPPLLIASASCAGLGLVLAQAQKTYNSKVRLTNYSRDYRHFI